jgi:hypothetical protein
MDGKARYHQIQTKARLINERNLRLFMEGKIDVLPCWGDIERDLIIQALNRCDETPGSP